MYILILVSLGEVDLWANSLHCSVIWMDLWYQAVPFPSSNFVRKGLICKGWAWFRLTLVWITGIFARLWWSLSSRNRSRSSFIWNWRWSGVRAFHAQCLKADHESLRLHDELLSITGKEVQAMKYLRVFAPFPQPPSKDCNASNFFLAGTLNTADCRLIGFRWWLYSICTRALASVGSVQLALERIW